MKRILCSILAALLLLSALVGCQFASAPDSVTLDSSWQIVYDANADDSTIQAALSLQLTLKQQSGFEIEAVTSPANKNKTITVRVNSKDLAQGQYRTALTSSGMVIEAHDSSVLLIGMRNIRNAWLVDEDGLVKDGKITVTKDLCASLSGQVDVGKAPYLVLTQNMRCANDENGNSISLRSQRFRMMITEYQPDIICTQETNLQWLNYFESDLSGLYGMVGEFDGGFGTTIGNENTILFRKDRFQLVQTDTFWMSETPAVPSKVDASTYRRICTWAILKDKLTGQKIFVSNLHLDNGKNAARDQQISIVLERLETYYQRYPSILTGDFNATTSSNTYSIAAKKLKDAYKNAEYNSSSINYTCDQYGTKKGSMLDYIFYNVYYTALEYRILNDQYGGYVSDHYGVISEMQYR